MTNRHKQNELTEYIEARSKANEARDCERCENWRNWLLQYSPTVRFMNDKIKQVGGEMTKDNINCRRCSSLVGRRHGAFDGAHGILLCANHLRDRTHTEDVLSHEMVHAYDYLRFDWDKYNMKHAACAEVRAVMLSGECRWSREFFDNWNVKFTGHFQDCVRRRAILAVMRHPYCKGEEEASQAVTSVWASCFADTRPFDEIYR